MLRVKGMEDIRLVLSDVDGVWTDGSLYFSREGEDLKRFSVYDGWGVRYCRNLNIAVGIITAEDIPMAKLAAEKFKTPYIFTGVKDKLAQAQRLCDELDIPLSSTAYIGDDLNDLPLLGQVGFSGCPANAARWVKPRVDFVCATSGGDGAFREFVEKILEGHPDFPSLIQTYARFGCFKPVRK
jgi:3-deoxy-D-manno-octulosonate 8-phosphate phosphatase (KDO 8-P phosphatase)